MSDGWRESASLRIEVGFHEGAEPKLPAVRSIAWLGVFGAGSLRPLPSILHRTRQKIVNGLRTFGMSARDNNIGLGCGAVGLNGNAGEIARVAAVSPQRTLLVPIEAPSLSIGPDAVGKNRTPVSGNK